MKNSDQCKCGHSRACHVASIGGCLYTGKEPSIIINFSDCNCGCNKFELEAT